MTKTGTEVAHITHDSDTTFKVKRSKVALVGCTDKPTWTYSNGDLSICVHNVYRVTTCLPGRGHNVAAAHLQLVYRAPVTSRTPVPNGEHTKFFYQDSVIVVVRCVCGSDILVLKLISVLVFILFSFL